MKHKMFTGSVLKAAQDGGKIRISTSAVDRDGDRVLPSGAQIESYMRNPVVLFGHNYTEPWAMIGRAASIDIQYNGIDAEFTLREPTGDSDPQKIIRSLWEERMLNAASIGFNPIDWEPNEVGGYDYHSWELLEFSLVPVPANQEAVRMAMKGLGIRGRDKDLELCRKINSAKRALRRVDVLPADIALSFEQTLDKLFWKTILHKVEDTQRKLNRLADDVARRQRMGGSVYRY
jgi:HK97 family phage prohead protease